MASPVRKVKTSRFILAINVYVMDGAAGIHFIHIVGK
jgi:hypothetical protein